MRPRDLGQQLVHVVLTRPVLEARPEPVARRPIPAERSAWVITVLPIITPGRLPENTSAPRVAFRASASTSSACRGSGTRWDLVVLVASAGLTQTAASRSNWSHVARRASTCRAAVSAVNRMARFVEGRHCPASIRASAAPTSTSARRRGALDRPPASAAGGAPSRRENPRRETR